MTSNLHFMEYLFNILDGSDNFVVCSRIIVGLRHPKSHSALVIRGSLFGKAFWKLQVSSLRLLVGGYREPTTVRMMSWLFRNFRLSQT